MEPVAYICFKVFFAYFACRIIIEYAKSYGRQTHDCTYWLRLWNWALLNINSILKDGVDKLKDKFSHYTIIYVQTYNQTQ